MHFIGKDSKVRPAVAFSVSAEVGEEAFRQAGQECAKRVSRMFEAENGAPPHTSWITVAEGPQDMTRNLRVIRSAVAPPTRAVEILLNGERHNLPTPADERTRIPVAIQQPFSWVGEAMPVASPAQASFDGWDANTGLMVFTTK